jgi:hypothetical protein
MIHSAVSLARFFRLPWHDRVLLVEATIWMAFAGFAIDVLPFRYVGRLAARPIRRPTPTYHTRITTLRRIRWAILTTARQVPWRASCFEQSLVAQLMLRRRGIPSVLHYGAAPGGQTGLSAHAWVRDGDVDVIGGDIAHRFVLLATFPPYNPEMLAASL